MQHLYQTASKLGASIILLLTTSTTAFATGGTITFSSVTAANVPTLSTTMIIVLSLLLFAVAVKVAKQKDSNANKFFVLILGAGVLVGAGTSVKLISDVSAGGPVIGIIVLDNGIPIGSNTEVRFLNDTTGMLNFIIEADEDSSCFYKISTGISVGPSEGISATETLPPNSTVQVGCSGTSDIPT